VTLFVIVALVIGLVAELRFAALQAPEPTSVPAILLESESPSRSGNDPSEGGKQGRTKVKADGQSGDSPSTGGSTGPTQANMGEESGGAQPAPPPPPAPAGDDDERENSGGDDGGDG
jgi:hypothetical protein